MAGLKSFSLVIILLLALAVRLLTFDRYLPLVDYPDEANMFLLAVDWRGDFPLADEYGAGLTGDRLAGYPPLFPVIAIGTQRIVEAISTEAFLFSGDYVYGLRLLAVIAGVLTTAALWLIGWSLGGLSAAALSALVWALSPVVVEWNSLAIPDPLVYLASAWTLAFALWAWHKNNPAWTLPSLLCAIAAIYLKYTPLHVLVAWGWVVLVLLRHDWRRMLPWLILEIIVGVASVAYLIFGYGALRLQNDEAMRLDPGMALNIERGLRNVYGTILPVGVGLFAAGLIAGIVAYSRQQRWPVVDWRKALYLLAVTISGVLAVSTFIGIEPYSNQMRHVLPVSPAVIGLWSISVVQIAQTLRAMRRPLMTHGVLIGTAALLIVTTLPGDIELIQRFAVPDPRYQLWQWSDASLPPDGKILMFPDSPLRAVWNRPYSGYDGQTAFEWAFDEAPYRSTPQALAEQGISYFAITRRDERTIYNSEEMSEFLQALTPLKIISAPPEQDEANSILIYRVIPPQAQTDVTFGGQITLIGYDLDVSESAVHFRPYWRAAQQPNINYSMFGHLLAQDEIQPIAQYDGPPAQPRRPAISWDDPAEMLIGADARIDLPPNFPPGDYRLLVGLYNFETGQRLLLDAHTDSYEIPVRIGE